MEIGHCFSFDWTMDAQRWFPNQAENHGCNLLPKENCWPIKAKVNVHLSLEENNLSLAHGIRVWNGFARRAEKGREREGLSKEGGGRRRGGERMFELFTTNLLQEFVFDHLPKSVIYVKRFVFSLDRFIYSSTCL